MTAHDDDQDLVTIRVPRRAAAMFAAELDVTSRRFMVVLNVYGQIAIGLALMVASAASWIVVAINVKHATYENLPIAIFFGLFTAFLGTIFLVAGRFYREALRRRQVLP